MVKILKVEAKRPLKDLIFLHELSLSQNVQNEKCQLARIGCLSIFYAAVYFNFRWGWLFIFLFFTNKITV